MRYSNRASDSERGSFLKVLGIGCLVIVILGIAATIFVVKNLKTMATNMAEKGLIAMIDEMEVAEEQKRVLRGQVSQLANGFRDGSITLEQMAEISKQFASGPIMSVGLIAFAQHAYFTDPELTDEEKKEADYQFGRYARGLLDGSITNAQAQAIIQKYSTTDANGNTTHKESLTAEERTELLELVKADADAAGVAEEEFEVDYGAEFQKIIDDVLGSSAPASGFDEVEPAEAVE